MREQVYRFGHDEILTGIHSEAASPSPHRPVVLILNAGLLHHVGPFRLHVELARALAAEGFDVVRFDRSGIGDSGVRRENLSEEERAARDVSETMDFFADKMGATRFVLMGLCAGAYHAHTAALADSRVVGSVFLDGYGYRTAGYRMRKNAGYLDADRLGRYLKRKMSSVLSRQEASMDDSAKPVEPKAETYVTEFPTQEDFARDVQCLISRDVRMLYIYTGGVHGYYNYREQFREMLPGIDFKGLITTEYFAEADHTYPVLEDRQVLKQRVLEWMKSAF